MVGIQPFGLSVNIIDQMSPSWWRVGGDEAVLECDGKPQ